MRIKEEDKCRAAFSMPKDACKPMVIFFELTNSLVIFQAIINDLLRNIIEIGDVVMFIDNIMVKTETKEVSQIRYLLVVILGLNSVSGVQYKGVMTDR